VIFIIIKKQFSLTKTCRTTYKGTPTGDLALEILWLPRPPSFYLKGKKMPKMKTHSGAKKRFSVTRRGKVQARAAAKRHLLTNKSSRMKREGRSTLIMAEMDAKILLDNHMPYERKKLRKTRNYVRKLQAENAAKKEAA